MRKKVIFSLIILILLGILIFCYYQFSSSGITITLNNNTNQEVKDLKLVCSSNVPDVIDIKKIDSNEKTHANLNLYEDFSEGNLKLQYFDNNNRAHEVILIDYFEKNYSCKLKVNITSISSDGILEIKYK